MGCSSAKPTLVNAVEEVEANPSAGLARLFKVMEQAPSDSKALEKIKDEAPHMFELLPKAMQSLNGKTPKTVKAACGVIVYCVKACNDPSLSDNSVVIPWEVIQQIQKCLVDWLGESRDVEVVNAVTLALTSLFWLEPHATQCKRELGRSGGIRVALKALQAKYDTTSTRTLESIALMLSLFADSGENVSTIIAHGGHLGLIHFVEEPQAHDVSKDMHGHCITVLQACLAQGRKIEDQPQSCQWLTDIQKAIKSGSLMPKTVFKH